MENFMAPRRGGLICICLAFATVSAVAQELTLDEILKKNTEAIGGSEAIGKIQTLKIAITTTSQMAGGQMDGNMILQAKRPNMVRTDINIMGYAAIAATDGIVAWTINPMAGSPEPQKADEKTAINMLSSSIDNSIGSLAAMKDAGATVEQVGKEEIGGAPTYRIKATFKAGMATTYFLDARTFLPVRTITRMSMMGQEMEVEGIPSDYRKVGGINVAHSIEQKLNGSTIGRVTYDKIEINPVIDDAVFKMPGKETPPVKK
jgi:outer membrane lipoprotein-sorting protein